MLGRAGGTAKVEPGGPAVVLLPMALSIPSDTVTMTNQSLKYTLRPRVNYRMVGH